MRPGRRKQPGKMVALHMLLAFLRVHRNKAIKSGIVVAIYLIIATTNSITTMILRIVIMITIVSISVTDLIRQHVLEEKLTIFRQ